MARTVREYRSRRSPRKEHDPLPFLLSSHHAYVPLPPRARLRSTSSKPSTQGSTQGHVISPQQRPRGPGRHTPRLTSHDGGGDSSTAADPGMNQGPLCHLPRRGGIKKAPKATAQSTAGRKRSKSRIGAAHPAPMTSRKWGRRTNFMRTPTRREGASKLNPRGRRGTQLSRSSPIVPAWGGTNQTRTGPRRDRDERVTRGTIRSSAPDSLSTSPEDMEGMTRR